MAKYTTQIRSVVESGYPLFDFDYPIFDEAYKGVLEQKIINRYFFREIGFETLGQFKHFLKTKLNEIMPYYNQLYLTEGVVTAQDYNINLDNTITKTTKTDQTTANESTGTGVRDSTGANAANSTGTSSEVGSGTSSGVSSGTNTGKTIFSDTPQAKLQGLDYATNLTDLEDGNTNQSEAESTSDSQGNSTSESSGTSSELVNNTETAAASGTLNTIEEYTEHLIGNASMRYNADILMEWRKSFLNIDVQILDELNELFMNVY